MAATEVCAACDLECASLSHAGRCAACAAGGPARGPVEAARGPIDAALLLGHTLAVWQRVSTSPHGFLRAAPSARVCRVGPPRAANQAGCPQSFGEFLARGVFGVSDADAFRWYARMRLRYSCSSLSVTFALFVVPELERVGIRELALPWGGALRLRGLRVMEVAMAPTAPAHVIELSFRPSEIFADKGLDAAQALEGEKLVTAQMSKHPQLERIGPDEFVEAQHVETLLENPPRLSHNMLRCPDTGVCVDFSLGQYAGAMNPGVYRDKSAFARMLPSQVLGLFPSPQSDIDSQVARDETEAAKSPDHLPAKFALRVVRGCEASATVGATPFCDNCFGHAPSLKRCTRCKRASYCSEPCQRLHWKAHKGACAGAANPPAAQ
ncbi:hypothetical protein M885DRAFT_549181 [Pelagophyceae sp. CCMP2097]|nr:hypothetical protein M885DRAFT_549181 [Pelagophyceae sp. CCMP2097]